MTTPVLSLEAQDRRTILSPQLILVFENPSSFLRCFSSHREHQHLRKREGLSTKNMNKGVNMIYDYDEVEK